MVAALLTTAYILFALRAEANQRPDATISKVSKPATRETSCYADWQVFSPENPLVQTQLVSTKKDDQNQKIVDDFVKNLPEGFFVHPPTKFAMCTIPKNSCTQWTTIMHKILNDDPTQNKKYFKAAAVSWERFNSTDDGRQAIRQLLSDPNAERVIFVRDPLARFASAYLNKCFIDNCRNGRCIARNFYRIQRGEMISFRTALNWILDEKVDPREINRHWALQIVQCGLDRPNALSDIYTIVGRVDKATMSRDATCVMEKANLSRFDTRSGPLDDPFWAPFQEMVVNGTEHYRTENEEDVLKKLYTPELARQFMEKYDADYKILHMPEPAWIAEATGEWLDSMEHHKCYGQDNNRESLLHVNEEG